MGNRRKTPEARIEQMRRNSQAVLDLPEDERDPHQYAKAAKRRRKAARMFSALRRKQQMAYYTHMVKESQNG